MKNYLCGSLAAGMFAVAAGSLAFAGPDLVTCHFGGTSPTTGFINHGDFNGIRAFSVLTIACNEGDQVIRWDGQSPHHPLMTQNAYRLRDGRFEQVGMSWVKHGIGANGMTWCTTCQPGGTSTLLGVGCCDAYGEVLNGAQNRLGPRSEINAALGTFPHPFCSPGAGGMNCPTPATEIDRRLQVKQIDLDPSPEVLYFYEVHHITADDIEFSSPRTDHNNASYRSFSINSSGDIQEWTDNVVAKEPAIRAWKQTDSDVIESFVDVPDDGRFWIAAKVTEISKGVWDYEYAVMNLSSDRSAQSFSVPFGGCNPQLLSVGFHDVDYHSGDPYASADWVALQASGSLTWSTQPHAQNPNANALRWSTLYNFRLTSNRPPVQGSATIGLFKPGTPTSVLISTIVPDSFTCTGDIAPSAGDCAVGVPDLLMVIGGWGPCADAEHCPADLNNDDQVGVPDLLAVIGSWGVCN